MSMPIVPNSFLPAVLAVSLFLFVFGIVQALHASIMGYWLIIGGAILLVATIAKWFHTVILDGRGIMQGYKAFDRSMRLGMMWFIFTEVMFFAGFFGVLFYIRLWALPQLGGMVESKLMTHVVLWPDFQASWPLLATPDGRVSGVEPVAAMGIPAFNTLLLLLSGLTITISHHFLKDSQYKKSGRWLLLTVGLGWFFLLMQGLEYAHAIEQGFTHQSGIYGNIFYLMTGFHGLHVFLGSLILLVIYFRMIQGGLSASSHFGFEASAWYWHFVDVVWLMLFVFVYWI